MERLKKVGCVLLLLIVLSCCGCQKKQPLAVVVERIVVMGRHGDETMERIYTNSAKKKAILNYLRWLRPQFGADCDPEQIPGDEYTITVTLSDGEQEVYEQKTNGYLRKDEGRWENIDPEKGIMLYEIISQMDGDEKKP